MNVTKELVSQSILNFRKANNLTQEQLASRLGTSGRQIKRWEQGKTLPNHYSTKVLIEHKILIVDNGN